MNGLDFGDAASQDIRSAAQYLKSRAPKVGLTGYCMGGALTLLGATQAPELDAAVVWYGCPPLDYTRPVFQHRNRGRPGSQANGRRRAV